MPGTYFPVFDPCTLNTQDCITGTAPLWFWLIIGAILIAIVSVCVWGAIQLWRIDHPKKK